MRTRTGIRLLLSVTVPAATALVLLALSGCATSTPSVVHASAAAGGAASASASGTRQGSASGSSGDVNLCDLVTTATAGSYVGGPYVSATASTLAPGQDQCSYATSDNPKSLVIEVDQPNSGVTLAIKAQSQGGSAQTVTGVGDKAILGNDELDVQSGSRVISIQSVNVGPTENPSQAEALAKAVIAALG